MVSTFIRVVALHKGKLKPAEFRLRKGERGLSLFELDDRTTPEEIVSTVKALGKRGELVAARLESGVLQQLGLVIVRSPGGTGSAQIDRLHVEARIPFVRRLWLLLRGIPDYDYFNERFASRLCAAANVQVEGELS